LATSGSARAEAPANGSRARCAPRLMPFEQRQRALRRACIVRFIVKNFSLLLLKNIDVYFFHTYIESLKGGDYVMAKKKAAKKTTKKTTKKGMKR
jgi:hypothetical protein